MKAQYKIEKYPDIEQGLLVFAFRNMHDAYLFFIAFDEQRKEVFLNFDHSRIQGMPVSELRTLIEEYSEKLVAWGEDVATLGLLLPPLKPASGYKAIRADDAASSAVSYRVFDLNKGYQFQITRASDGEAARINFLESQMRRISASEFLRVLSASEALLTTQSAVSDIL